ncbi:PKD domain-containing protein [Tautonia rosea]|uniref:PKD domain-containing protein n=1 Tax=Tautonia rosea TaxID=2728037 RepID=UPI001475DFBD|nr:PKD domain-containing protein [Tautonia rosea]
MTSPTSGGLLPEAVSRVGGIVLDLIGENGRRIVSQVRASNLFVGNFSTGEPADFRGNPGTIGVRSGFSSAVVDALGGSIAELSVRLTLEDGDTGPGDFDRDDNTLLLNGITVGRFDQVTTVETNSSGTAILSQNPDGGFRNDLVDTGFFHVTDPETLQLIYESIRDNGVAAFQLLDVDPFDNFFDFTVGIDSGLIDVELPPEPQNQPPRIRSIQVQTPVVEGTPSRVIVVASDPDPDDQLTFDFSLEGNGRLEPSDVPGEAWLTVPQSGDVRLTVRVEDPLGAFDEAEQVIVVSNAPPSVTIAADQDAIEGTDVSFSLGAFDDPSPQDRWSVEVDWGDGSPVETFDLDRPGRLPDRSHRYLQDGQYEITVRVNDGSNEAVATARVLVRNAPPRLRQIVIPDRATQGSPIELTAEFSDPGPLDPLTVEIDWGTGSPIRSVLPPGSTSLSTTFQYDRIGTFVVTVTLTDDQQEAPVLGLPVTVAAPDPPRLPSFRFDPEPVFEPQSPNEALAEALLPARSIDPEVPALGRAPGDPGGPPPAIPPGLAAPIAILVGQDAPDLNSRSVAPPVAEASAPMNNAEETNTVPAAPSAPSSSEVASAEAETQGDAAIGSEQIVSAEQSSSSTDADSDSTIASVSVGMASAEEDASAASAASSTAAADDPGADSGSKAMRATVLIVAALTVRRGGTRIRKSLRASSVGSARR